MVQCPRCGCEFIPEYLDIEDDIDMVTLRCPSCKIVFARNVIYLSTVVKSDAK
ncbi:MAG: hypothetical protein ACTSQE_17360 [Candidatus Heimdallarchaeaceae archaeon]